VGSAQPLDSEVPLSRSIRLGALLAALAAICLLPRPASAGTCGAASYGYAGVGTLAAASGISATIASTAAPRVRDGHIAGWVGVGGVGEGPAGTDAWIQIGLSAFPGDSTTRTYYEVARPDQAPVYHELRSGVRPGEQHRFAVAELPGRPSWWQVSVDGSPAAAPVFMPGSHRTWTAQALGESWSGGTSGTCNDYSYAFGGVTLTGSRGTLFDPARRLDIFQDGHYRLVRTSRSSFLSTSSPSEVSANASSRRSASGHAP
jgi:hypothetical protein